MVKGLDPATVRDIKALVKSWKATQRLAVDQARTPQMPYSSITGSMTVYDDDGKVAAKIGRQDDGSYAPTVTLGPVPPQPSPPVVSDKNVGQASITWDGHWLDDVPAPLDHARMEVHLTRDPETAPDEEQSSSTRWASIVDPAGGTAAVSLDAGTWFARLVARSQADRTSEPSEPVEFEVKGVLDRDEIVDIVEAAGGGFSLISATTPPPDPDPDAESRREGDMWWQRHPGPAGAMFAAWRWESGAWVEQPLSTDVFDFVNAAHIRGDLVQAMRIIGEGFIIAGDPEGANAAMTAQGFVVSSVTEDGVQYTSIRLGSGADEVLQIVRTPGEPPVASISTEGDIAGQSVTSAGDVTVAGTPVVGQSLVPNGPLGWLDMMPRGLARMASMSLSAAGTWPNNVNSAMGWFTFPAYAGRVYSFEMPWDGQLAAVGSPSAVRMTARVYQSVADAPGMPAAEPTLVNENLMTEWSQYQPTVNSSVSDVLSFNWQPWASETLEAEPREVALLISVYPNGATFTSTTSRQATWRATVTDIGPADASKMVLGSAPGAAAQRRYVTTWVASNTRAYAGDGAQVGGPNTTSLIRQGLPGTSAWTGHAHSVVLFNDPSPSGYDNAARGEVGKTMSTALNGAQISRIEIYLYPTSWRRNGNNRIHLQPWDGGNSIPATHTSTANTGNRLISDQWSAGVGQWVTVPSTWMSGVLRAIQVGPLDSLAGLDLGRSGNLAGGNFGETTTYRPKVRVTYTKSA